MKTQAERVLAYIRANPGCTTMQIQLGLVPFISNPRARISDLRAAGYVVDCVKDGNHEGYFLRAPRPVDTGVQPRLGL